MHKGYGRGQAALQANTFRHTFRRPVAEPLRDTPGTHRQNMLRGGPTAGRSFGHKLRPSTHRAEPSVASPLRRLTDSLTIDTIQQQSPHPPTIAELSAAAPQRSESPATSNAATCGCDPRNRETT